MTSAVKLSDASVRLDATTEDLPPPYAGPYDEVLRKHRDLDPERLRRFLSYCLAVDYGLEQQTTDRLRKDDWFRFTRVSTLCFMHYKRRRNCSMLNWSPECSSAKLDFALFTDADTLGVPRNAVVLMLRMHVACTGVRQRHNESAVSHIERNYSRALLARKLCTDRDVMFNALLPSDNDAFRQLMVEKNSRMIAKHFEYLHRNWDYRLTKSDQAIVHEREASTSKWQLSEGVKARLQYAWLAFLRRQIRQVHDEYDPLDTLGPRRQWAMRRQQALCGDPPYRKLCCYG